MYPLSAKKHFSHLLPLTSYLLPLTSYLTPLTSKKPLLVSA